jgi:hypothetical protein
VYYSAQKSAGGEYGCPAANCAAICKNDAANAFGVHDEVDDFTHHDCDIWVRFRLGQHSCAIDRAVGLCAGALHRGPLAAVQQSELDTRLVGHPPHDPIKGINFANKVPFAKAADGGIAGHDADTVARERDKRHTGATARRCMRGFGARMAAPDDNDI